MQTQLSLQILLNPSVMIGDELRLSKQGRVIFRLFSEGRSVSNIELSQIARQYNARLYELRRALISLGWCVDLVSKVRSGVCFYKLVPLEGSTFYGAHRDTCNSM